MKNISILIGCLFIAANTQANDTEIYGATAINENNRIKSNVLLIVDNSGSMDGAVNYLIADYDPNTTYTGDYDRSEFYISKNAKSWDGFPNSALETSSSTGCTNTIATLAATGEVTGNYQQYYKYGWNTGWTSNLNSNSNRPIRCNGGSSRTLYSGNYMNFYSNTDNRVSTDRMAVVKKIVTDLTYSLSGVNLGMMRFDTGDSADLGGMVDVAIADITTNAQTVRDTVKDYDHETWTPLSETLYEAQRYYSGSNVDFGEISKPKSVTASRLSSNTSKYDSPINHECQKNHIIMLTDGAPSHDEGANSKIKTLVQGLDLESQGLDPNCSGHGGCMAELAYYMYNVDQSDEFTGKQVVATYTVGAFGDIDDTTILKRTAEVGGGLYYDAKDPEALSTAINDIILKILAEDSTFTAPAISVNAFNNSEHKDELFYAVFKPNDKSRWFGNLKKFTLGSDGKIYDKNSKLAIDSNTGYFSESSQDHWSTMTAEQIANTNTADGKDVTLGGASNLLNPNNRIIYSDSTSGTLDTFENVANATTLEVNSDAVDNLKKWVKGFDVKNTEDPTTSRFYMGDPLHSEPVVITYGGTLADPDSTIYFGSNEGFVHAIDTEDGNEEFSFLPQELHRIQNINYEDNTPAGSRPYGMDGPITSWMYDLNNNNVIYSEDNSLDTDEHVYLYAGMRRGGRSYYGLNVTNRDNPQLLFKIQGGTTGFEKLGQTWSKMTVAKVLFNGSPRFVLFFAGGYDTNQDSNDTSEADTLGNAIYMVDASTGDLLWRASNDEESNYLEIPQMVNSIPASLAAVDITGEGYVDYLFAADTGGRVFRIDINQANTGSSNFAKGGMIASIAGSDEAGNRRFYNKPNVALVKNKQKGDYLTISIGSGYRAHPLNEAIEDRFYLIKDLNPYSAPATYNVKTEAPTTKTTLDLENEEPADSNKLYNVSSLMLNGKSSLTESMSKLLEDGGGWYITFSNTGEKVLSESTTFSEAVIFTTFSPSTGTRVGCGGDTGQSRTYALNQNNAMAIIDLNGDGSLDSSDTSVTLSQSGIAPRPVIIYRPGGGKTIAIGTETIDDDRFNSDPVNEDCEELGNCPTKKQECTTGNCYVVPQYWRQNTNAQ